MKLQHVSFLVPTVALATAWMFVSANCSAQLLPPGDFNGKSFQQWGLDYGMWSAPLTGPDFIVPDPSRQDTVNGVRYLPVTAFGIKEFSTNLTITPGTALFGSPFSFFGERYDDGHADDPTDAVIPMILDQTTVRATLDGVVVLDGTARSLSARQFGPSYFPVPIAYTEPQQRGPDGSPLGQGLYAVASAWTLGIGTMYANLPRGEHTLRHEFNSEFFGGAYSNTYHISVVPEPATLMLVGIICVIGLGCTVRGRFRRVRTTV
jgi:hypothetical protein